MMNKNIISNLSKLLLFALVAIITQSNLQHLYSQPTVVYEYDWEDGGIEFDDWVLIPMDSWEYFYGIQTGMATTGPNYSGNLNWMITPELDMEENNLYKLEFSASNERYNYGPADMFPEYVTVCVVGLNPSAGVYTVLNQITTIAVNNWDDMNMQLVWDTFTIDEFGCPALPAGCTGYHIAFVYHSPTGQHYVNVDDFSITWVSQPRTLQLNITAGANGSVSPAGSVTAYDLTPFTLNFTPDAGYTVDSIYIDGMALAPDPDFPTSYTFIPLVNHNVNITFKPIPYPWDIFSDDFSTGQTGFNSTWTTLDSNNDNKRFEHLVDSNRARLMYSSYGVLQDDWMITTAPLPCVTEGGNTYEITYDFWSNSTTYIERLTSYIVFRDAQGNFITDTSAGAFNGAFRLIETIWSAANGNTAYNRVTHTAEFVMPDIPAGCTAHLGFHCWSNANAYYIWIDDIQLKTSTQPAASVVTVTNGPEGTLIGNNPITATCGQELRLDFDMHGEYAIDSVYINGEYSPLTMRDSTYFVFRPMGSCSVNVVFKVSVPYDYTLLSDDFTGNLANFGNKWITIDGNGDGRTYTLNTGMQLCSLSWALLGLPQNDWLLSAYPLCAEPDGRYKIMYDFWSNTNYYTEYVSSYIVFRDADGNFILDTANSAFRLIESMWNNTNSSANSRQTRVFEFVMPDIPDGYTAHFGIHCWTPTTNAGPIFIDDIKLVGNPPLETFEIDVTTGPHGTLVGSSPITVNCGQEITLNFDIEDGYEIDSIVVDGVSYRLALGTKSFTFRPTADCSVSAAFMLPLVYDKEVLVDDFSGGVNNFNQRWTVLDVNNDARKFTYNAGRYASIDYSNNGQQNDWLISDVLCLEQGRHCRFSFDFWRSYTGYVERVSTYLIFKDDNGNFILDTSQAFRIIQCETPITTGYTTRTNWQAVDFVVPEVPEGYTVHLGLHCWSAPYANQVRVGNVKLMAAEESTVMYTIDVTTEAGGTLAGNNPIIVPCGQSVTLDFDCDDDMFIDSLFINGVYQEVQREQRSYTFYPGLDCDIRVTFKFQFNYQYRVFTDDFSKGEAGFNSNWTVYNLNGDANAFRYDPTRPGVAFLTYSAYNNPPDDWMISPPLCIYEGNHYMVSYDFWSNSVSYTERLTSYIVFRDSQGNYILDTTNSAVRLIYTLFNAANGYTADTRANHMLEFTMPAVPAGYTAHLAFHSWSQASAYFVFIDNIKLMTAEEPDNFVVNVSGSPNGTVSPIGQSNVYCGEEFILDLQPEPGYRVKSIKIGNQTINIPSNENLTQYSMSPIGNTDIFVEFGITPITLLEEYFSRGQLGFDTSWIVHDDNSDAVAWKYNASGQATISYPATGVSNDWLYSPIIDCMEPSGEYELWYNTYAPWGTLANAMDIFVVYDDGRGNLYVGQQIESKPSMDIDNVTTFSHTFTLPATMPSGYTSVRIGFFAYTPAGAYSTIYLDNVIVKALEPTATVIIEASAGANGSIVESGDVEVMCGSSTTFTFEPNEGYRVDSLIVDGKLIPNPGTSYTIAKASSKGHTIHVTFRKIDYVITLKTSGAPDGGTNPPPGDLGTLHGENLTIKQLNPTCYDYTMTIDGTAATFNAVTNEYVFENITSNHAVVIGFTIKQYEIEASVTGDPGSGTISNEGTTTLDCGGTVTYEITPAENYEVDRILVNGESVPITNSYTFLNVKENNTIEVSFAIRRPLIIARASGPSGSIEPSGAVLVDFGADQTFQFVSDAGFKPIRLIVDETQIIDDPGRSYTFTNVTRDHSISVIYAPANIYRLNVTSDDNGSVSTSPELVDRLTAGDEVLVTAIPAPCFEFVGWTNNANDTISTESQYTVVVISDTALKANFVPITRDLRVEVRKTGDGTVSPANTASVPCGSSLVVSATPDAGSSFINWTDSEGNVISEQSSLNMDIVSDTIITANFIRSYRLALKQNLAGAATLTGDGNHLAGSYVHFSAKPNRGYRFLNWTNEATEEVISTLIEDSILLNTNYTLVANFEATFNLILKSNPVGAGTLAGLGIYKSNTYATFAATARDQYTFLNWTNSDGDVVSTSLLDSMLMVSSQTLTANFTAIERVEPIVTSLAATDIKATTVVLNGEIIDLGVPNATNKGFEYSTVSGFTQGTNVNLMNDIVVGTYQATVTGLTPLTTYYYKAFVISAGDKFYGEELSFTTSDQTQSDPVIYTRAATNILYNEARLNGEVIDMGYPTPTKIGFRYNNTSGSNEGTDALATITSPGTYSVTIYALVADTTYYYRAFAEVGGVRFWGEEFSFKTLEDPFNVTLGELKPEVTVSNINSNSATANAVLLSAGGTAAENSELGFVYSSTEMVPELNQAGVTKITCTPIVLGPFTANMTDLQSNTYYYVRGYYTNSKGTVYTDVEKFETPVGIIEAIRNDLVKIYPNPANYSATVSFDLEESCNLQITLCDLSGRELVNVYDGFAIEGPFMQNINTSDVVQGVYFVKITINGKSRIESLVVE